MYTISVFALICISVKYYPFIYYCIKVGNIELLASHIQLSLQLFWLVFFCKALLHLYSQPEGHESHNTTRPLTFHSSCNTEQHGVALKIYTKVMARKPNKPMHAVECKGLW